MLMNKDQLPEHLKDRDIKVLGFPRTERYANEIKMEESLYKQEVVRNLVDMHDPTVPNHIKENIEVIVDMVDPHFHKVEIDVKRNETRAQELIKLRKEILERDKFENNTERVDHNVLILYFDNLSRVHYHRKLKKLDKWLEQFTPDKNASLEATEFMRYHTISKNTYISNNGMYFNQNAEVNHNETLNVFKYFSQNGYVTGMFDDECKMSTVLYEPDLDRPPFYNWDHFGSSISCDYNYDRGTVRNLMFSSGRNSQYKRCLYGKNLLQIQFEYLMQFWEAYPDVRKFFRTSSNYAHEFSGELVQYADDDFVEFLQSFYEKGYLNDTQLLLISDHGAHFLTMRVNAFPDDSRRIENALPLLIHLAPKDTPEKYLEILRNNQQLFLNSHDIYATLRSLAEGKLPDRKAKCDRNSTLGCITAYSYFNENLPNKRDCESKV
jgi:hypothetical protein